MNKPETSTQSTTGPKGSLVVWIAVATPVAVGVGVALFFFLTWWLSQSGLSTAAKAQTLEYYDVARSVVVLLGIAGAGVGLVVAWRRQTVQEHQLRLADRDLKLRESIETTRRDEQQAIEALRQQERKDDLEIARLHDLQARYVEAATQLGHESAAVRLAGVNALGRLASEWSDVTQRQSCVDVLCGYLRMPARLLDAGATDFEDEEVRSSIVRLIASRLRPETDMYWKGVSIDLSRAVVDAVDFSGIQVEGAARFVSTRFQGNAVFESAVFHGECEFSDATFEGNALFERALFERDARFINIDAQGEVIFTTSTFAAQADFHDAHFRSSVLFSSASFIKGAVFDQGQFTGRARFQGAVFKKDARFSGARFHGETLFGKSIFSRGLAFGGAEFFQDVVFDNIQVTGRVGLANTTFLSSLSFRNARLSSGLKMTSASVQGDVNLEHATIFSLWHLDNSTFEAQFSIPKLRSDVMPRLNGTKFATEPKWSAIQNV